MSNIDTAIRHLLNGVIISAKTPKIELDSETKTIALTVYKDSYICVGFDKYFIEEDSTSFITYTDNCIVTLTYNSYTKLFSGVLDDSIPDDTMAIGYLIIANGKLENSSWVSNCSCEPSKLSISAPSSIVISNTNNKIVFPGDMTILFNNKSYPITRHPDIDLKNINGIISLYYNPSTHRFTINNLNEENSILIATYDKTNDILSYNPYPTLICVEAKTTTPDYDVALWGYNYDKTTHSIEWDKFYCVNKTTGEVHSVPEGSFELDKKEVGYFMIIFNQNIFEVSVINNPNFLPENCVILDTFTYTLVDGFKTKSNTDNKLMPLEGRINKLAAIVDENILNPNTKLLLTDKLYIVNNNPILKTSMTIAGLTTNTITIIDSNGNISYPSLGATFNEGLNTIYSGNDSKTVEVFKYTSEEVNKDYKFGIIAHEDVYRDNLSLPGSIVFAKQITESYEALVGIDTTKGHSPFMRIAGSLDKEKYPAWCYRKTGAKNELSYALSSDKSGDFYILISDTICYL